MSRTCFIPRFLFLFVLLHISGFCSAQTVKDAAYHSKMQWFRDAKLGIFIHWGIYAVDGIPESWAFFNNYISYDDYMKQLQGFTAQHYRPEQWASLIEESGARYAVLTTRHHDGVALWDSKQGGYNVVTNTPAKRDLVAPWVTALRKRNVKVGFYYSLPDWSYTDYDVHTRVEKRYHINDDPGRWNKFLNYYQGQLNELKSQHNPDLYWFDGDWEHSAAEWQSAKVKSMLMDKNPNAIFNSRLNGYGDYDTPEQGVPVVKPHSEYWELCYTINDSWGYQENDNIYKTPSQLIRILSECVGMGGNLLLDIGPKADGTIDSRQVHVLKTMGAWNKKHEKAVFGSRAGLPAYCFAGPTSFSADYKSLFLFVDNKPSQPIVLKNFTAKISGVSIVGKKLKPDYKVTGDQVEIVLPDSECDDYVTVVEIQLGKPFQASSDVKQQTKEKFVIMNQPELATLTKNERWKTKHAEALTNVSAGLPDGCYWGLSSLSEDKQTLYLFVNGKPNGSLMIKGLSNRIFRTRIVGNGTLLEHQISSKLYWSQVPGVVYIDVPEHELDDDVTVIAILLDGPLKVYTGESKPIESN